MSDACLKLCKHFSSFVSELDKKKRKEFCFYNINLLIFYLNKSLFKSKRHSNATVAKVEHGKSIIDFRRLLKMIKAKPLEEIEI